jgi:hypothetical protein
MSINILPKEIVFNYLLDSNLYLTNSNYYCIFQKKIKVFEIDYIKRIQKFDQLHDKEKLSKYDIEGFDEFIYAVKKYIKSDDLLGIKFCLNKIPMLFNNGINTKFEVLKAGLLLLTIYYQNIKVFKYFWDKGKIPLLYTEILGRLVKYKNTVLFKFILDKYKEHYIEEGFPPVLFENINRIISYCMMENWFDGVKKIFDTLPLEWIIYEQIKSIQTLYCNILAIKYNDNKIFDFLKSKNYIE